MLILLKVAVTGGLASGKSTVCSLFQELGSYVVSSDRIVHHLLSSDTNLGKKIIKLLGNEIIENGQFSRKKIAEKVFADSELLKKYEAIIHPSVWQEIEQERKNAEKAHSKLFIVELPLLFEAGFETFFDYTITVVAPENLRIKRYLLKTHLSEMDFHRRVLRQLPVEIKEKNADTVIVNDGSLGSLSNQVTDLFHQLVTDKE